MKRGVGVLEMELGDGLGSECWGRGVRRAQSRDKHGRLCWRLPARQCGQQKGQVESTPTSYEVDSGRDLGCSFAGLRTGS